MAEREISTKTTLVPDASCAQFGSRSVWGLGNALYVFAGNHPPKKDEVSGANVRPHIHQVKWDTEMHKPISRKLVNETHDIFLKLQNMDPNEKQSSRKASILTISREYRSVVKACELEMKSMLASCHDEVAAEQLQIDLGLLSVIELVWNLIEILFVDTLPGGVVLQQLLDWLKMHFTDVDKFARQAMQEECPEQNTNYWDAVFLYVLQGRTMEARKLLSMHTHASTESYILIDQLLTRMPCFSNFSGQSVGEFDLRWRHWQSECVQRLDQGDFDTDPNINTICKILCGRDEVFVELRHLLGEWYCMLLARLLYQQPTVKAFDLHYHAGFCLDAYGGHSAMQTGDSIILAALEYDIHQLILESSSSLNNWWFSAHITDLLHHCGKLDTQSLQYGSNLREFLLLEYASSLMSHVSLWQTGVDYLDHCQESGRAYLEHYIEKIPLESEKKAQKVIRICEQRDMQDQIRSVCKVMGMKALHNGRLGSALSWGLRSKDVNFATFLAEKFLNEYSDTGDFSHLDLLDNLGPSMLLSSKLTFLGKYREFHKLYEDGDFKAASTLLLSLLTAKIAPRKFWMTLLTDALPMLEAQEVIFDGAQTFELHHCLEEINSRRKLQQKSSTEPVDKQREEREDEKLNLMRLGLSRNLARAIVMEGTLT